MSTATDHNTVIFERDQPPISNRGVKQGVKRVISLGVDWVSASAKHGIGPDQLYEVFRQTADDLQQVGDQVKHGARDAGGRYLGDAVGSHLFFGNGREGVFLRASSSVAHDVMLKLKDVRGWEFRCTRVDLQVTIMQQVGPGYFRLLARRSDLAAKHPGRQGKPWEARLVDTFGRGDTVYIGSVKSDQRARAYDKHKEDPEHYQPGSTRFEVQNRDEFARGVAEAIKREGDLESYTHGYVDAWFSARGVELPVKGQEVQLIKLPPHTSDAGRQIRWLRSLRPMIRRLEQQGRREEVLEALGLAGGEA